MVETEYTPCPLGNCDGNFSQNVWHFMDIKKKNRNTMNWKNNIISLFTVFFCSAQFLSYRTVAEHLSTRKTICVGVLKLNPSSPPLKLTDTHPEMQPPPTYVTAQVNQCCSIVYRHRYVRHRRCHRTKGYTTPHVSLTFPLQSISKTV